MTILHLEWARRLRKAGSVLRRDGLSQRAAQIMVEHVLAPASYKQSMVTAGRLMAICQAAKFDVYWTEQVEKGFHREMEYLRHKASEVEAARNETQSSDGGEVADGAIGPSGLTGDGLKCQPSRREGETTPAAGVAPCPSEAIPLPGSFPFTKAVQG